MRRRIHLAPDAPVAKTPDFPKAARVRVRRVLQEQWGSLQTEGPPVFSVYEVEDADGRVLALKAGTRQAVEHELAILKSLSHPAIVRAHERVDRLPSDARRHECGFTMDRLEGVDFVTWVRGDLAVEDPDAPRTNLPMAFGYRMQAEGRSAFRRCSDSGLERLRRALPVLASALAAVHEKGFIHFDVQPHNVICAEEPVLVDLANAVAIGHPLGSTLYGLPSYVAPEFADSSRGIASPTADAYSLGALFFEALTGQLPFPDDDPVKVITSKLTLQPPVASELVEDVPADLDVLIAALLARSPTDRPSLRELL